MFSVTQNDLSNHGKHLALAGGGLPLRSREAFQICGAVTPTRRLMPSDR